MKKFEIGLIIIFLIGILINFFIDNSEDSSALFGLVFLIFSVSYLFGGYFLFKPKENINSWKFLAILNGVFVSFGYFLMAGKFVEPIITYNASIFFLSPLFIIIIYLAYRVFRKSTSINEKSYFRIFLTKNIIIFTTIFITATLPGDTFSKFVYGSDSYMYYKTLRKVNLYDSYVFRQKGEYDIAINKLNSAISYSERLNDTVSALYQECVNELGYNYYLLGEYNTADSVLDITINIYYGQNPENIKNYYEPEYQMTFYNAIYKKALLHSAWNNFTKSDSLFNIALVYYKDNLKLAFIYNRLGYNQYSMGDFEAANKLYSIALDYHQRTNFENKEHYIWTQILMAENCIEKSEYHTADSILSYCDSYTKKEFGLIHEEVADVLDAYVLLNIRMSKFEDAEKFCLESIKIRGEINGKKNSDYLNSVLDLVSIYLAISKYREADELLKQNLKIVEDNFDNRCPIATKLYDVLSQYNEDFMYYERAREFAEKSLNGRVYWDGEYHINTATSYHNLASAFYYLSNYDVADSLFLAALSVKEYYKGVNSPSYANSLNGYALVYLERDSFKLAKEYFDHCLKVYENCLGTEHPDYATILCNIASLKIKQNQLNEARNDYIKALSIYQKTFKGKHLKIAMTYYELGDLETCLNQPKRAADYYTKAIKLYESILGPNHYFVNYLKKKIIN